VQIGRDDILSNIRQQESRRASEQLKRHSEEQTIVPRHYSQKEKAMIFCWTLISIVTQFNQIYEDAFNVMLINHIFHT
jgi:hypothetical protein